jgi:hypothetical protein
MKNNINLFNSGKKEVTSLKSSEQPSPNVTDKLKKNFSVNNAIIIIFLNLPFLE